MEEPSPTPAAGATSDSSDYIAFSVALVVFSGLLLLRVSGVGHGHLLTFVAGVWTIAALAAMTRLVQRRLIRAHRAEGSLSGRRVYRLTLPYSTLGTLLAFAPLFIWLWR